MTRKDSAHIATCFWGIVFAIFLVPKIAIASEPQKCTQSEACKIGEFLYNDDYTPNSGATCTITSRDPSGALYLNATALTYSADGYYSTSTTPTTLGTYPSQICCTSGAEYMCLDKTFQVVAPVSTGSNLTASDVWNYSDRSLTSMGDLVADIWGYTSRSLTAAITVDTSTLATKNDLEEINKINKENRVYLEKLVNKPIIQNFIDDKKTTDVTTKIIETKNVLNNLFATTQNLKNRSQILSGEWSKLNAVQIASEINQLKKIVNDTGSNTSSLTSHTNWLKSTWNDEVFLSLTSKVDDLYKKLDDIEKDTNKFPTAKIHSSYLSYINNIGELDTLTGNTLSDSSENSAFGFLQKTQNQLTALDKNTLSLQALIPKIQESSNSLINSELESIQTEILAQNQVKSYLNILTPSKVTNQKNNSEKIILKNKIYSLLSLININKLLIAGNSTDSIKVMWLEEGSIVFRTVATNPSRSVSQEVNVKFYLPAELKKEQIMAYDPALKIDYDAVENALYAETNINLGPQESQTFTVETEDIWQFNPQEIEIIKKQATDLTSSLKGTALYTQASSTKSDIVASLDKIMLRQSTAITPENRIKTYRESLLEMVSIQEKIDSLKLLTAQNNSTRLNFSFLGGAQVVSIWGIVILGLAAFIFLAFYLKTLKSTPTTQSTGDDLIPTPGERTNFRLRPSLHHHKESKNIKAKKITTFIVLGLIGSGAITVMAAFGNSYYQYNKTKKLTLENSKLISAPKQISLSISSDERVPVKSQPSISSPEVLSLKTDQSLYVYRKLNGWAKVGLTSEESGPSWWISELYLK